MYHVLFHCLLIFSISVSAAVLSHEFVGNSDLSLGCRFDLGEERYDLCPLMRVDGSKEARTTELMGPGSRQGHVDRFSSSGMWGNQDRDVSRNPVHSINQFE